MTKQAGKNGVSEGRIDHVIDRAQADSAAKLNRLLAHTWDGPHPWFEDEFQGDYHPGDY